MTGNGIGKEPKVMFSCEEHSEPDRMRVTAIDKVQHHSFVVHNKFNVVA